MPFFLRMRLNSNLNIAAITDDLINFPCVSRQKIVTPETRIYVELNKPLNLLLAFQSGGPGPVGPI